MMRIGAKLPNSGPLAVEPGIPELARTLEEAGFDSLWVPDHVVLPRVMESRYPFAADGRATWATDTPVLRRARRARARRRRDRARRPRHGRAGAPAAPAGRDRQAAGLDRRRERRQAHRWASAPAGSRRSSTR